MFILIFCIALVIAPIYAIISAFSGRKKAPPPAPPAGKDPADRHMDDTYADVDWLRKGKL